MTETTKSASTKLNSLQRLQRVIRQSPDTVLYRLGRSVKEYEITAFFHSADSRRLISMPEYAVFAAMVYGDIEAQHARIGEQRVRIPEGWQLQSDFPTARELQSDRRTVNGLHYQVWYSQSRNEIVIAFRGTDGNFGDWYANARWITRFIPFVDDHYDVVGDGIDRLVAHAHQTLGSELVITVVGHSLGGGLAQHAAYSHNQVSRVCAFNSSPVTGYFSVERTKRLDNRKSIFIARIFEHGEVLAYVRFALRKLYRSSTIDPEIIELRFNFEQSLGVVSEHSMSQLARNIWAAARSIDLFEK